MFRNSVLSACMFAAATLGVTSSALAQNDSPTKDIYFTFSQSVTVPNMTLPAGRYQLHIGPNTGPDHLPNHQRGTPARCRRRS